ncbi:hypothetical protein [Treponema pectinovorum]|uniref:hypothetical protein n=1 Tax=Treponema pectinovorum TaxID=164 RepID=UPI0011C92430|nr:hypothetical protein [Treponema pectinovorum]
MMNVCVCGGCGRTIEKEFLYCPWCGQAKMHNDKDALEAVFRNLEQKQAENREKRLKKLEKQLDDLEQDLSILALSAEMAK